MTYDELIELKEYLSYKTDAKTVVIGKHDLSDMQYPAIQIIPDEGGIIDNVQESRMNTFSIDVKLQIVDTDEPEKLINTLKVMDDLLREINEFHEAKGHYLEEDFTTEYTANNYTITFVYRLKLRQHNIGG
jgi:hypothetical protein